VSEKVDRRLIPWFVSVGFVATGHLRASFQSSALVHEGSFSTLSSLLPPRVPSFLLTHFSSLPSSLSSRYTELPRNPRSNDRHDGSARSIKPHLVASLSFARSLCFLHLRSSTPSPHLSFRFSLLTTDPSSPYLRSYLSFSLFAVRVRAIYHPQQFVLSFTYLC